MADDTYDAYEAALVEADVRASLGEPRVLRVGDIVAHRHQPDARAVVIGLPLLNPMLERGDVGVRRLDAGSDGRIEVWERELVVRIGRPRP